MDMRWLTLMLGGKVATWTDNESAGAIPNGERIVKSWAEEGDATPIGMQGTVLGSIGPPDLPGFEPPDGCFYLYFVEWDDKPGIPVGVTDRKVAPVNKVTH
jgi:hypothetical protein